MEFVAFLKKEVDYTVKKKFSGFPVPSREVTYQTLPEFGK
jgi:hypothetical protein